MATSDSLSKSVKAMYSSRWLTNLSLPNGNLTGGMGTYLVGINPSSVFLDDVERESLFG
jgi:hypothetical protein